MRDNGNDGGLPPGWASARLLEIAELNPALGRDVLDDAVVSFVPMAAVEERSGKLDPNVFRPFGEVKKGFTRFRDGDLVFAKITPSMENGKIALAGNLKNGVGCGTTELHVIRPKSGVSGRYLLHYLLQSSFREIAKRNMKGTAGQLRVPLDFLANSLLPLPPSGEQERIVAKIDELFSDVEEGERCLARAEALLKQYRQSVLKAAVTGELTRDWRAKNKGKGETGADLLRHILRARREAWEKNGRGKKYVEPEPPNSSDFPELPNRWTWASVDQLCAEFRNGLPRKPREAPPGIPILRISAVRPLSVDPSDIRYYPDDGAEDVSQYWVQTDDLLFTRYNGSQHLVGICGRFIGSASLLHPDKLMKARVADASLCFPAFLEIAANAGVTRRFIDSRIKTTAGQHGISGTDVKAAPIPLPPPEEQQQIVKKATEALESNLRLSGAIDHEAAMSASLRQSILRAAFSGKVVPQDPADEPAAALLQRIAAERASAAESPKLRRRGKSHI